MKKLILTTLLLFAVLGSFAQDTAWTKSDQKLFGSKAEEAHEDVISQQSESRFLSRFIGFKRYYGQNISAYLQARMDYSYVDSPNKPGYDITILSKNGVYFGEKAPKVIITFRVNKSDRILSGKIKGPFLTLASLFLNYWPQDPLFENAIQLQQGTAAVKHCYGDLISFKWIGGLPYIIIAKDPNISFPVPPIDNSLTPQ